MAPQKKKQGLSPFHPDSGRPDSRPSSKPEEVVIKAAQVKIVQHWSCSITTTDGRRLIFILHPSRKYRLSLTALQKNFSKWAHFLGEDQAEETELLEAQ
jgi:hypothetical protein